MEFLHPVFTVSFLLLIAFSFFEVYGDEYRNFKAVWIVVAGLVIFAGLRYWVGADYPAYNNIFKYYGEFETYDEVFRKALFQESRIELEWIWVLLGKIFFDFGIQFHFFVLLIAVISVSLKYVAFEQAVVYPALSMALYLFPNYFSGDMGQMRQAAAMGILLFSFIYIKKRNLWMYLLMMYLAMGFHKSAVVFLPAYWLATINLNATRMLVILLVCVILSPFQVYNYFEFFTTVAPDDVAAGFSDYAMMEQDNSRVQFTDLLSVMYMFFMVSFDKEACRKIPYYEYMRNIGFFGICFFYIFRMSPIFSSRLTAIYLVYMVMVLPNIVAAISNINYRRYLHFVLVCFAVFYYIIYTNAWARKAGFTPDRYNNHLFIR